MSIINKKLQLQILHMYKISSIAFYVVDQAMEGDPDIFFLLQDNGGWLHTAAKDILPGDKIYQLYDKVDNVYYRIVPKLYKIGVCKSDKHTIVSWKEVLKSDGYFLKEAKRLMNLIPKDFKCPKSEVELVSSLLLADVGDLPIVKTFWLYSIWNMLADCTDGNWELGQKYKKVLKDYKLSREYMDVLRPIDSITLESILVPLVLIVQDYVGPRDRQEFINKLISL